MKGKSYKRRSIVFGAIITIIIVVVSFSFNLILGSIARHVIDSQLEIINKTSNKKVSVGKIHFNIWNRTLILKNISVVPDSCRFEKLKQGKLDRISIMEINIPKVKLRKLGIFKMLTQRNLLLKKILVHGVAFTVYKNNRITETKDEDNPTISIDSIPIK